MKPRSLARLVPLCAGPWRAAQVRLAEAMALGLMLALGLVTAQAQPQKAPGAAQRAPAPAKPAAKAIAKAAAKAPAEGLTSADPERPVLRLAVPQGGVPGVVELAADGSLGGALAQWLLPGAAALGQRVQVVVVPSSAAALQAVRVGQADMALVTPDLVAAAQRAEKWSAAAAGLAASAAPASGAAAADAAAGAALLFTLGTGAQPLAVFAQRERPAVPLDRARVAVVADDAAQPSAAAASTSAADDHLRRHHPAALAVLQPSVLAALQAVAQAQPPADLALLPLLPALQALQLQAVPGLELRQVLPAAAGHHHLALRAQHAAWLPALNKLIISQRSGGNAAHQAVLRYAQSAAPALRAPLALPADGPALATEVMASVLKAPFTLKLNVLERQALAERARWKVGAVMDRCCSHKNDSVRAEPVEAPPGTSTSSVRTGQSEQVGVRDDARGADALLHADAQGRAGGVAADAVQEVAQRLGVLVDWVIFDNEAALLDALRAGRVDAVPLLQHTPEHARTLAFSLPWLELPHVLVGRAQGPLYWGLESLRGLRLALPAPTARQGLRNEIQRLYPGIQIVDAPDTAAALALVAQGQAEAAVDLKPLVAGVLASSAGAGLRVLGDVTELPAQYRFALAEGQRVLLPMLDAALQDMPAAEHQRSLRRWLAHDLQPQLPPWQRAPLLWGGGAALLALGLGGVLGHWRARRQAAPLAQLDAVGDAEPSAFLDFAPPSVPADAEPVAGAGAGAGAVEDAAGAAVAAVAPAVNTLADPAPPPPVQADQPTALQLQANQELQAPTHALAQALQTLSDAELPLAAGRPLAQARGAAQALSQMLDDMRAGAELDAGQLQLQPLNLHLAQLLDDVVGAQRVHAEHKGLRLTWLLDPVLPARIHADPQRLAQVLRLLLVSAIENTAQGRVQLKARVGNLGSHGPALLVDVRDTRASPSRAPEQGLFEAAVNAVPPALPGLSSPLALHLCARLVQLMGGSLSLHSKSSTGAAVTLRVPLRGAVRLPAAQADSG